GIGSHMNLNFRRLRGAVFAVAASLALASCISTAEPPAVASASPAVAEAQPTMAPSQPAAAERLEVPPLIPEALAALDAHANEVAHRDRIAVVDFSLPSSEPRFHIVDVETGRVEGSWLVAHGSGSDPAGTGMVQSFSNEPGSHATSRGAYLTAEPY